MWEQKVTQYVHFQEGQVLAKLLTLGWTLLFASLCYEMGSLKRFISLDLDPVGFIVVGPSSHQVSSQRAKAIRKQWKRNTTVFTFLIVLAWCPDLLWNLLWGWLLKTQEWSTKEWRVFQFQVLGLPSCWRGSDPSSSPGWQCRSLRSHLR